ncbi:MAG: hypothetical protein UIG59_06535 [Acutalibacteraceae bacterium]|nr:hypothetical protein [Acutalibacteraceae bacterium]
MIKLIIGNKGSGKTKKLIDLVNTAAKNSPGNVVCVEKGDVLTFSVAREVRLIDVENYGISGYDEYYAMLCGIAASNHDITHIFGDATKKIGGGLDGIDNFLKRVAANEDIEFVFTISCDEADLPAAVLDLAEKI